MSKVPLRTLAASIVTLVAAWLPPSAHAVDTGAVSFDLGVPILYTNNAPITNTSASAQAWSVIAGNFRVGITGDMVFNIAPEIFGLGISTGLLASYGSEPGTDGKPIFILDSPVHLVARIGIGDASYVQVHGGIVLKNIANAATIADFRVLRYVDVGARVRIGGIGFTGGYLIEIAEIATGSDILPSAGVPFYVGLYIPVL